MAPTPATPPMALPISFPIALPARPAKASMPADSNNESSTDSGTNSGSHSRRTRGGRAGRRSRPGSAKAAYPAVPPIYSHLLQLPALAAPFVGTGVLAAFPAAVQQLLPQLSQLDEHLKILLPRRTKNWTHELSTALLLSSRWRVATDRKLAYLLQLEPAAGHMGREEAAARLLYAVACWRRDGYAGARKAEVGWQVDGLLAAFCEPGVEMDRIALADHASAVAVWCCGRAWEVQLFGDDGEPKSVPRLYRELQALTLAAEGMVRLSFSFFGVVLAVLFGVLFSCPLRSCPSASFFFGALSLGRPAMLSFVFGVFRLWCLSFFVSLHLSFCSLPVFSIVSCLSFSRLSLSLSFFSLALFLFCTLFCSLSALSLQLFRFCSPF